MPRRRGAQLIFVRWHESGIAKIFRAPVFSIWIPRWSGLKSRTAFPQAGLRICSSAKQSPTHFQLMKILPVLAAALLAAFSTATTHAADPAAPAPKPAADVIQDLKIGDPAPPFSLLGIDGEMHSLAEYKDAKVLMVAFISNHCPDSHAAEERIKALLAKMKGKGFGLVAINPNNPEGLTIDELGYSKYDDGYDDMVKYAAEREFSFPYLYDGDTQAVARAYGCLATPHVFIFDAERKLRYKGYFDDSQYEDVKTVKAPDARKAVEALLAGQPVPVEITRPHGCSTKWITKKAHVAQAIEKWDKTPVDVAPIDVAGIMALRKNDTKKLRLFNVWATWCGPCVAEFPELVKTARKFDMRDFEFISISADDPKDSAKVKAFLEKRGAGLSDRLKQTLKAENRPTNSYVFEGGSMNDLLKNLDAEWTGGVPHTVLVAPGGQVLWRHTGPVNGDELRGKVLDYLGTVYKP
jgi:peroxiredoxin